MKFLSEELRYALNLPLPPIYSLRQDKKSVYKVPEFFGYESPATRWILAMLTNKANLKRLIKCGKTHEDLFSRYYQVPDRPMDLMPGDYSLETPAYHQQMVLYLTPLALALYIKQLYAVEMLLDLRNESGHKLVHPAEPCFVQKVFKKGTRRIFNELSNTFPILIAIRRNFFEGVGLLLECGFTPQKQLSIINRVAFKESINLYRDVVDYMVELLRKRPCLNVTKFMKLMTDTANGLTTFDVFVFDLELDESNKWDYVSVFRRVCRIGLATRYFIEESAIQIINVLEQIQVIGYFGGVNAVKLFYNNSPQDPHEKVLSKKTMEELQSERISVIMDKIPTIIKATRDDLFQLDPMELSTRINFDYQVCIGCLFFWYQKCQNQDRCGHYMRLSRLMSRIILDTRIIEDFFVKSDEHLASVFSEWCMNPIKTVTISDFRIRMQDYILFTDHLCIMFINRYDKIPNVLINAPMLHGRDPGFSPIVRELLHYSRSSYGEAIANNANTNQNNPSSNPLIFNVCDTENHISLKFIPANHVRHFSLDKCLGNTSTVMMNKKNRHHHDESSTSQVIPRQGPKSAQRPSTPRRKPRSMSYANNSNSIENLNSLSLNDERNSLRTPPCCCKNVTGIKSPNADLYNSLFALTIRPRKRSSNSVISSKSFVAISKKPPNHHHHHSARTKSSNEIHQRDLKPFDAKDKWQKSSTLNKPPNIRDEELKQRLKVLLASNSKFRDLKLDNHSEKVPLKCLRSAIGKFKSVDGIIRQIQSKLSTQLDCLSNNLIASSMIRIMQELSLANNTKSPKSKCYHSQKSMT